jgi:hypothetical protein
MCSSKKNSCKQKNDLNTWGEYLKFDEVSSKMRESMIKLYVKKVMAHAAENGGSYHQGFAKELVNNAAQVAPLLKITHDNINNKVRNIQGPREQQEVSPAIPYRAIGCPTHSTILDSCISTVLISERTSAENPLFILANQASVMLEPASQCAKSMQLTLPNQCSYEGCGVPLNLVREHCSSCLRLVHQLCQQFLPGPGINISMLPCWFCCDKASTMLFHQYLQPKPPQLLVLMIPLHC